jgi:hypothetical protein
VSNPTLFATDGILARDTHTGAAGNSSLGLSLITATFGPRYTLNLRSNSPGKKSFHVFGQTLIGPAWGFDSYFPSSSGAVTQDTSFALQIGGGLDIGVSRHIAIRAFQGDWLRTQFPNGTTNVQNSLRLGAGIVFRMPHGR